MERLVLNWDVNDGDAHVRSRRKGVVVQPPFLLLILVLNQRLL